MPPTKIVIIENREINQAQAASPPPLRTTYVNARFRIHKTSQTVSAATLSPLRIYIIAFSNLFYNKITRLFAFYISVFRVFAPYPHALRPLRPCDKKPPRPKPRRRSGFCGTNDPRRARSAPTPRREPCRRADTVCSQNIQKTKIKPERDKPHIALSKKMLHSNVRSVVFSVRYRYLHPFTKQNRH